MSDANRDKTIVITGGSRGLGAGMAVELHQMGYRVATCARSQAQLADDGDRAMASEVDVTDHQAVVAFTDAVTKRFGTIDLWINNAGVLEPIKQLRDVTSDEFRKHIEINVIGVFHGTHSYVHHLHQRGASGVLVNISSGAARHGYSGWSAYCAGKAAVDLITECVAIEEEAIGLRAHSVAPGIIDTGMQELIRGTSVQDFPMVGKFLELKSNDAFSSAEFVAHRIAELAFDSAHRTDDVLVSLPSEKD